MLFTVAEYERDAEAFCQRAAATWLAWRSGQASAPDLKTLHDDWGFLFGTDLLEQLGQEVEEPNRRRFLLAFCTLGRLRQAAQRELQALAAEQTAARAV